MQRCPRFRANLVVLLVALAGVAPGCAPEARPGADPGGPGLPVDAAPGAGPPDARPGPSGDAGVDVGGCGGQLIQLERLPTRLVVVLDRSSSMLSPATPGYQPTDAERGSCRETNAQPATGLGYRTRWDDVGDAITAVAEAREQVVQFGLTIFPGPGGLGGAATPQSFCTALPPATLVTPAYGTAAAIRAATLAAASTPMCAGGFTPTRAGLLEAADAAAGEGPAVLVLATDGAPNCAASAPSPCVCTTGAPFCNGMLGTIGCMDDQATVATLAQLAAGGVRTYVIGIPGSQDAAQVLDQMAQAGGAPRQGAATLYYQVGSAAELADALGLISDGEASCRFALAEVPPSTTDINVLLDGTPIVRDTADGWHYLPAENAIELAGASCAALRGGAVHEVQFVFGCPPVD